MLHIILNIAMWLAVPLLFTGLINRTKAWWAGRRGASLFQPWHDLRRLLGKGQVISNVTSPVFQLAPAINLAAVILAALLVPLTGGRAVLSFSGDFIVFAFLLAAGKFVTMLAALDTGSSFEGMGASREAFFSSLIEPGYFILLAALVTASGETSFTRVLSSLQATDGLRQVGLVLGAVSLFIMLLVEGCRVPVDDPNTHLELTMIHEVMVLDHSGPDLAFIQFAAALKMTILGSLMAGLILPPDLPAGLSCGLLLLALGAVAIATGLVESLIARLRLTHVPQFIFLMTSNALIVLAVVMLSRFGGID